MYDYAVRPETKPEKNKTGIPDGMKSRFERSNGLSFDDVRVHYNSEKPAQLHAHAYTQGSEVYVAPGQEKHLPHELGHIVQQKSNMVRPTEETDGVPMNTDKALEDDADRIAENAKSVGEYGNAPIQAKHKDGVVQKAGWGSDESYNFFAGPVSGIAAALGVIGGVVGFGISKYSETKHKYTEQIEKYADAAEEACSEAEASYYKTMNTDGAEQKTKYAIETKKYARKAIFNGNVAKKKYGVKRNMKHSKNASYAKERADDAINKSLQYERDVNQFIPNGIQQAGGNGGGGGAAPLPDQVVAVNPPAGGNVDGGGAAQLPAQDSIVQSVEAVLPVGEEQHQEEEEE